MHSTSRIKLLIIVILVTTMLFCSCSQPFRVTNINDVQCEGLIKLCKIWGFVKYNHPSIVNGKEHLWDDALVSFIPKVLMLENTDKLNEMLIEWIDEIGPVDINATTVTFVEKSDEVWITPLLSWTDDINYLGSELYEKLVQIKQANAQKRTLDYGQIKDGVRAPFLWDNEYSTMNYSDARHRLLGLFRYWNAFMYFSPYGDLLDDDWDKVLMRLIHKMLQDHSKQSYLLCLSEMAAATKDGHASIRASYGHLYKHWGEYLPPVLYKQIEENIVITDISQKYAMNCSLQVGDIVLSINGVSISEKIKEQANYIAIPCLEKISGQLQYTLFRSNKKNILFTILRENKVFDVSVSGIKQYLYPGIERDSYEWVADGVCLINPGYLAVNSLPKILDHLHGANGIILDLRQYPTYHILLDIPEYIMGGKVETALIRKPVMGNPGTFYNESYETGEMYSSTFQGKLLILIDQNSMSQSEFIAMVLRQAPNALVIGESTLGMDGDIIGIPLPGNNYGTFSGYGVFTPTGKQTQRVGIHPDIEVSYTIQGIKNGRDEILDAAIDLCVG